MSASIERYYNTADGNTMVDDLDGDYVLHTDHLVELKASHAYDEAVERAAFEDEYPDLTMKRSTGDPDAYWSAMTQNRWTDWLRCAKSRAKRFGGAE